MIYSPDEEFLNYEIDASDFIIDVNDVILKEEFSNIDPDKTKATL